MFEKFSLYKPVDSYATNCTTIRATPDNETERIRKLEAEIERLRGLVERAKEFAGVVADTYHDAYDLVELANQFLKDAGGSEG